MTVSTPDILGKGMRVLPGLQSARGSFRAPSPAPPQAPHESERREPGDPSGWTMTLASGDTMDWGRASRTPTFATAPNGLIVRGDDAWVRKIESIVNRNARDVGYKGKIKVEISNKLDAGPEDGDMATATRLGHGNITILLPSNISHDEALEQAMAAFVHGASHEYVAGYYDFPEKEEILTYIRGSELADRLGVGEKFDEMGKHYVSHDLAFAESWVRGKISPETGSPMIDERDIYKAREFIDKRGFQGALNRMNEIGKTGKASAIPIEDYHRVKKMKDVAWARSGTNRSGAQHRANQGAPYEEDDENGQDEGHGSIEEEDDYRGNERRYRVTTEKEEEGSRTESQHLSVSSQDQEVCHNTQEDEEQDRRRKDVKNMKKGFSLREAKGVGDSLGVEWDEFDVEEFRLGMDIELEHGTINPRTNITNDNPLKTGQITLAHLSEDPCYNTHLTAMERKYSHKYREKTRGRKLNKRRKKGVVAGWKAAAKDME